MKFSHFIFKEKEVTKEREINLILSSLGMDWLIEAEFESADVEIKHNTLIWKSGTWYWGEWFYGIWKSGTWHDGIWKSGIWENGDFMSGKFESGIWLNGNINGGDVNIHHQ